MVQSIEFNCPDDTNPDQKDLDGDGIGDACDLSNMIIVDKTLTTDHFVIADVIVQNGVKLTIPAGKTLTINSANLLVSGEFEVSGGTILLLP